MNDGIEDRPVIEHEEFERLIVEATRILNDSDPDTITSIPFGIENESVAWAAEQFVLSQLRAHGLMGMSPTNCAVLVAKTFMVGVIFARLEMAEED